MQAYRRGFTIIELLITLVVMAGLLTLGVMAFGNSQLKARDERRTSDITAIARGLEQRYEKGNSYATGQPAGEAVAGSYPSINEMQNMEAQAVSGWTPTPASDYKLKVFTGTQDSNFVSPTGKKFAYPCTATSPTPLPTSCTNTAGSSVTISTDLCAYIPIDADGNICVSAATKSCVSFTLLWKSEADGTIKPVKSKRR